MKAKFSATDQFFVKYLLVGSEMASQQQWFCSCFTHRSSQSPDITWINVLYFSLGSIVIWPDPNLDLFCPRQLVAASFYENDAKLYFDVKYLKTNWIGGAKIFGALFSRKYFFWSISVAALSLNVKMNIPLFLSSPTQLLKYETTESQSIAQ